MKIERKDTILYIQQTYEKLETDSKYFNKVIDACASYLMRCIKQSARTPKEKTGSPMGRKTKRDISPNIKNILRGVLTNKIKEHLNRDYAGRPFLLFDTLSHYYQANQKGYNTLFRPSVDRIDCGKDYVDGNIDIKTMYDNKGKGGNDESDFNEYNNSNILNNNKMKNQNNTLNNNTIQLTEVQNRLIKHFVDNSEVHYAVAVFGQLTKDEPTITITTNLKQSIQTNIQTPFKMVVTRFNNYLKNKPAEELGDNVSGYRNITARSNKGNDFCKLKVSSIGKYIVEKNFQLYIKGKSEYYITNKDYSDFEKNKRAKIKQAA